ncbi:MAG: zinc ABC transporter substrate-binding protein [Pseudomonadota bacterium]
MKRIVMLFAIWLGLSAPAMAKLDVFACEPEWAALLHELGGVQLQVFTATTALQDPHRIQARPSLIAQVRNAELLVCTGADLEAGWLPMLLQRAANPKVLPGKPGYFEAAAHVELRDRPATLDRAQGDLHAAGNPHINTDPRLILKVAQALSARLQELDAAHRNEYQQRLSDFSTRWQAAMDRWQQQVAPLRGVAVVTQHQGWVYLLDWLGMHEVAVLEPKPGIEPSGAHLAQLLVGLKQRPARMILHAAYQNDRSAQWLSQRAKIPVVALPYTVGANEQSGDLFDLFDDTVNRLLEAAR